VSATALSSCIHHRLLLFMVGMTEGKGTPTPEQEKEAPTQSQVSQSKPWTLKEYAGKTVWDWLQLLIVPVMILLITVAFTWQQNNRQEAIEERRAQDLALQGYLDQMGTLMLEDLSDSRVQPVMRARTLTVLRRLDPSHKREVMQFLLEAELVQRVEEKAPIINLSNADLSGASLSGASLSGASLSDADLSYADLSNADLSNANLISAHGVTKEGLKQQAESLEGTIMPDGTINAERYATREFEPALSFSVSDAWRRGYLETSDALLIDGPEGGGLIFTNPRHVYDPSNPSEPKEGPAPKNTEEWVSWFQSHPNLDTSEPVPMSVGGASGKRIDVTYSSAPEDYPRDACGGDPCFPLYKGVTRKSTIVSYEGGWPDRFIIVDVGGETVIIDVTAPTDKFEEFAPIAQKVLETVEWENSGPS
jgi:hypothetical protein